MSLPTEPRHWSRDKFIISTDKRLLSIQAINHVFGQEFMYWVEPFPEHILQNIVDNSFCFGLYKVIHNPATNGNVDDARKLPEGLKRADVEQIGFARLVTDNITFGYLTDLYVLPEYQGLGLGGWLIDCVDKALSALPYLRWIMLRTSVEKSKDSYEKRLGMSVLESGDIRKGPVVMGKKGSGGRA